MKNKLLVIGIDAMDPRIARRLMSAGKLPNFSRLNFSPLATTVPPETPVAWSAAATGSNPGRYGIYDFLKRDLATYLPKLNLAEEKPGLVKTTYSCAMKGEPFWRTLSAADIPVTVVRWPVTFPAEKVTGNFLSGLGVVDLRGSLNNYAFYTTDQKYLELEGSEKVTVLKGEGGSYTSELAGPMVRKRGELRKITVPLEIKVEGDSATIAVGDQEVTLKPGEWGPLTRAKFRVLPLYDIFGVFNFHLVSLDPLALYFSSIQVDPENQAVEITAPPAYGKELVDNIGLFYTLGMAEDTKAVTDGKLPKSAFFQQVKQIEEERERMFDYEFARFKDSEKGALALVFDAGDRLNHIFWENHDNIAELGDDELNLPEEIEWYYTHKDKLIGEVLDSIDDDTALIALSDHGFSDFKRQVNINSWLIEEGYMTVSDDGNRDLFGQVDWSESSAYSLGFTSLFINLEGRESKGIVPQGDKDAVIDEISMKLQRLKDGKRDVVTSVYKGAEIFKGAQADQAPDIVVGFAPGYRMSWRSAIGAHEDDIFADNTDAWQGDHLIDPSHVPGVIFANFDINSDSPSLIDIAPTILKLMGQKLPAHIDGEPLV